MGTEKDWLANYSWEFVTAQNLLFCRSKNALHKPTSDGHEATRDLWNTRHLGVMALEEAVDLCRQCHRLAPFCFYNGNTFAAIIRDVVGRLELPVEKDAVVRSLARHIVAGVATGEEEEAFRVFCESLD